MCSIDGKAAIGAILLCTCCIEQRKDCKMSQGSRLFKPVSRHFEECRPLTSHGNADVKYKQCVPLIVPWNEVISSARCRSYHPAIRRRKNPAPSVKALSTRQDPYSRKAVATAMLAARAARARQHCWNILNVLKASKWRARAISQEQSPTIRQIFRT